MYNRFFIAVIVVVIAVSVLVLSAVENSAKAVLTVDELVHNPQQRIGIRVGARVTDEKISYRTNPSFLLEFFVRDIAQGGKSLPVRYEGIMPDTLKAGRDVILEGDYDGTMLTAKQLLTQCPSKYEVPLPVEQKLAGEPKQAGDKTGNSKMQRIGALTQGSSDGTKSLP